MLIKVEWFECLSAVFFPFVFFFFLRLGYIYSIETVRAMKEEIAAAVFFVARLVKRYGHLDADGRERFAAALTSVLFETYKNHWEPNTPTKGQAYRCVARPAECEHTLSADGAVNERLLYFL